MDPLGRARVAQPVVDIAQREPLDQRAHREHDLAVAHDDHALARALAVEPREEAGHALRDRGERLAAGRRVEVEVEPLPLELAWNSKVKIV